MRSIHEYNLPSCFIVKGGEIHCFHTLLFWLSPKRLESLFGTIPRNWSSFSFRQYHHGFQIVRKYKFARLQVDLIFYILLAMS